MNFPFRVLVGVIGMGGCLCSCSLAQEPEVVAKFREIQVTDESIHRLLGDPALTSISLRGGSFYGMDRVTDEGLKSLAKLTNLKKLELLGQEITDDSLQLIGTMTTLEVLDLTGCSITEDGLKHLKGLVNLKILRASLTGAGLVHLGHLSKIEEVDFSHSFKATLEHIKYLSQFPNLRRLRFPNQVPTDEIMAELSVLTNLEFLEIGHCSDYLSKRGGLTEEGFAHLASMRKLTHLELGGAQGLTQSSIKAISTLTNLRSLSLVVGRIDVADFEPLGALRELEKLMVWGGDDKKEGELKFLSQMKKLVFFRSNLHFNDRQFQSLCEARNLTEVIIQSDLLSNTSQAKISQLRHLKVLQIQGEGFGRSSIQALRQLPELRSLNFHNVPLRGLTVDLGMLQQLERLQLGYERDHGLSKEEVAQLQSDLPNCEVK